MKSEILQRIKSAIAQASAAAEPGGRTDPQLSRLVPADMPREERIALFMERAASSGAGAHRVSTVAELAALIAGLIPAGSIVAQACSGRLQERCGVAPVELVPKECSLLESGLLTKDRLFRIDAAITEADAAIAETGSIALAANPNKSRLISLVALVHVALVWPDQIVPDLLDWSEAPGGGDMRGLPGGITLITGPSKTADIETKLVQGVHGPAAMHVVVVD